MSHPAKQRLLNGFGDDLPEPPEPSPEPGTIGVPDAEVAATWVPDAGVLATEVPDTGAVGDRGQLVPPRAPMEDLPDQATLGVSDSPLTGKSVWIIDSHSLIYQVFHAMPEMTGPSGQPVGAVHGFVRDLLDIIEKKSPDYLICAFDHSDVTFRNELYGGYKQHRASMPDDLRLQFANIDRMLDALGIVRLSAPGFEADDILATLARRVREEGGHCVLVTNDKDVRQLLSDDVRVYNIRKDEMLDAAKLWEDWGVRPEQVVDYQALVGDSVDAVPGVPLIGPKMARELLGKFDSLDGVYARLEELGPSKRKENLVQFRDQAMLSRQLVRLRDDVPCDVAWANARVGSYDAKRLESLCEELGFRRMSDRIMSLARTASPKERTGFQTETTEVEPDGGSSCTSHDGPPGEPVGEQSGGQARGQSGGQAERGVGAEYHTVDTADQLAELVHLIAGEKRLAVDLETTSIHPRWAEIVGYALAFGEGAGWYVPVKGPAGERILDGPFVRESLRGILEDPSIEKIGQNIKYDMIVLRCHGIRLEGVTCDTMVADYLLAPGERSHGLDDLARRYLKHETIKITSLIGKGKNQKRMDEVPIGRVTEYAGEDAVLPLRLAPLLRGKLQSEELDRLFTDVEMPLIDVLAEMEFNGIRVDGDLLAGMSGRFGIRLESLRTEIHALAGTEFNVDSPRQLAQILFERLKLPVLKRTRESGPSTDVDVLEELAALHALPAKMVAYRQTAKLKSTYIDALPKLIHPQTGRVHTSFKQDVAATGRLSSKDPNLQNIPVRTEEGRLIRSAFLPAEGWRLLTADYSQVELRVLAHFSRDSALLDAFARDEDVHTRVASEVFQVPLDGVTSDMRRRAKAVNFGVIYGQSAFGLAKGLGIPKEEGARFIDAYFARYPGVDQFMEKTLDTCREKGYVSTILGRRRPIEGVRTAAQRGGGRSRTLPERIAINTVIQGSAADIIKQAMIRVHRRLVDERWRARMLLQIHDELVFELPPDELSNLAGLVETEMTRAVSLDTPLKVDLQSGANWADCDDIPR